MKFIFFKTPDGKTSIDARDLQRVTIKTVNLFTTYKDGSQLNYKYSSESEANAEYVSITSQLYNYSGL